MWLDQKSARLLHTYFAFLKISFQKYENLEAFSVIFKSSNEKDLSPVVSKTENANVVKSTFLSDTDSESLTA